MSVGMSYICHLPSWINHLVKSKRRIDLNSWLLRIAYFPINTIWAFSSLNEWVAKATLRTWSNLKLAVWISDATILSQDSVEFDLKRIFCCEQTSRKLIIKATTESKPRKRLIEKIILFRLLCVRKIHWGNFLLGAKNSSCRQARRIENIFKL